MLSRHLNLLLQVWALTPSRHLSVSFNFYLFTNLADSILEVWFHPIVDGKYPLWLQSYNLLRLLKLFNICPILENVPCEFGNMCILLVLGGMFCVYLLAAQNFLDFSFTISSCSIHYSKLVLTSSVVTIELSYSFLKASTCFTKSTKRNPTSKS